MKIKSLARGCVCAVIGLALLGAAVKSQAVEILTPTFLAGTNLVIGGATLTTNTYSGTNVYVRGGTTVTNTSAIADVTLQKNPDGSWPTYAFSCQILGTNAATTNNITFVFRTVPTENGRVTTEGQDTWSFAINANGTTAVVLSTNMPSAFMLGAKKLRLTQIISTAATGAGTAVLERANLGGGM